MKTLTTCTLLLAIALAATLPAQTQDLESEKPPAGISRMGALAVGDFGEGAPDTIYEDTITLSEPGTIFIPLASKEGPLSRFFGGISGHRGRILFNIRGATSGLTFAVQLTDLYWEYDGWTGCYNDIWSTRSCGTSNGWTNSSCTNTVSGGGSLAPQVVTTGSYAKSGDSFTISYQGVVSGGIRLTLGPATSISSGTLPEDLLINYQVLNWVLY